jgi:hypothetical protein
MIGRVSSPLLSSFIYAEFSSLPLSSFIYTLMIGDGFISAAEFAAFRARRGPKAAAAAAAAATTTASGTASGG